MNMLIKNEMHNTITNYKDYHFSNIRNTSHGNKTGSTKILISRLILNNDDI